MHHLRMRKSAGKTQEEKRSKRGGRNSSAFSLGNELPEGKRSWRRELAKNPGILTAGGTGGRDRRLQGSELRCAVRFPSGH